MHLPAQDGWVTCHHPQGPVMGAQQQNHFIIVLLLVEVSEGDQRWWLATVSVENIGHKVNFAFAFFTAGGILLAFL
jgi:hypothetical protein